MDIFLYVPLSGVFFYYAIKYLEPVKTVLYLKCYCILMMSLSIEALIRGMIYARVIWGDWEGNIILFFLIASILILCFCVLTLNKKFARLVTGNVYLCFVWILGALTITFSRVSLEAPYSFDASSQIISAWGCITTALYGLSQYTVLGEAMTLLEKQQTLRTMRRFWGVLIVLILSLLYNQDKASSGGTALKGYYLNAMGNYRALHPEAFSEFATTEAVDIIERLREFRKLHPEAFSKFFPDKIVEYMADELLNPKKKYTGGISLIQKNEKFSLQYNIEAWLYRRHGVPLLFWGAYNRISLENYKKELAKSRGNYNSPDLDSPYDGIGEVFFQEVVRLK